MLTRDTIALATLALLLEAALGYPDRLFRLISHPVVWIGTLIGWTDRRLNRTTLPTSRRRRNGVLALLLFAGLPVLLAALLQGVAFTLLPGPAGLALLALPASSLLAQRSLLGHVDAVRLALDTGNLADARTAVGRIVGRDTAILDESGIARAAIESLAENFSDAVVAPLLWCVLLGLPGLVFYKAVNTADSMIGHLTPRHAAFGWAAARLDDAINLPASRLSAVWLVLAAWLTPHADAAAAAHAVQRDAGRHRSPNAGWPEAAMAGALGLRLAGPRHYHGETVADAWMGDGRPDATASDLARALRLARTACLLQGALLLTLLLALLLPRLGHP